MPPYDPRLCVCGHAWAVHGVNPDTFQAGRCYHDSYDDQGAFLSYGCDCTRYRRA